MDIVEDPSWPIEIDGLNRDRNLFKLSKIIHRSPSNVQAYRHQKPMMTWQKRRFILKIAKAKNARASGVG